MYKENVKEETGTPKKKYRHCRKNYDSQVLLTRAGGVSEISMKEQAL
jgi:hypothetical protein